MTKISTYPLSSPPALSSKVIGTNVSSANATENFLLSDIYALFGSITGGSAFFNTFQNYEVDGNLSGSGLGTLDSLGYSIDEARAKFPNAYALVGNEFDNTYTYDAAVIQEGYAVLATLNYARIQSADNRQYVLNHRIIVPAVKSPNTEATSSYMFITDWAGSLIHDVRTDTDILGGLFRKIPINASNANNYDIEYAHVVMNVRLRGTGVNGQVAFEFGSSKRSFFKNILMTNFTVGASFAQMLNMELDGIETVGCEVSGVSFQQGLWSGATNAQTVSQFTIRRSRFNTSSSGARGLTIINCDSVRGDDLQFEGSSGDYGLYYDTLSDSTVTKNAMFTNLRWEHLTKYATALIGYRSNGGFHFVVSMGWHQATVGGTYLIETQAYGGNPQVILEWLENNGGVGEWKINNLNQGTSFSFNHVRLHGDPQNVSDILASGTAIFATTMPTSNRLQMIAPIQPTP